MSEVNADSGELCADESDKYSKVIRHVFRQRYKPGMGRIPFSREDMVAAHEHLKLPRTKNIGDIPYSFRFRRELPKEVADSAPKGSEWIIMGVGFGTYEFRLASPGKISPSPNREKIPMLDATPEIVRRYAPGTDEQALLTRARYNRLVDLFLGLTCYSVQNHLRTTVQNVGQIEVDEVYVGVNKQGVHHVIPCQAKSPGDRFGIVQVQQDMLLCAQKYPEALCRPIALQFQAEDDVAMLELGIEEEDGVMRLEVVDEKHYRLCRRSQVTDEQIRRLRDRASGSV